MIPYGRQWIDDEDVAAVSAVLRADWLTCGPMVEAFERALAEYCGAKHAVAVSSGTAALHVGMLAAGIGPAMRVLTSANTFLASANCAEFVGSIADFADIDAETCNATAATLDRAWREDVRAVVPVDFAGLPCDMPVIAELGRSRGAVVIEDASHAIGSRFRHNGREYKVGGHPWADMTTFSFHPVKTITTGEGGAVLTDNDRLAKRCRLFRNHGIMREQTHLLFDGNDLTRRATPDTRHAPPWYYEMGEVGFNYRLTDVQGALGLNQLAKLDRFIARRAEIVAAYNAAFASLPHSQRPLLPDARACSPAWHLYVLQIDFAALGRSRAQVMGELRERGIGTQVHYIPVHLQPYYRRKYGYGPGKCPVAEEYYQKCLSLPLFPAMTDADVDRVIGVVSTVVRR
jgi:UDP-4-amino-4,6-dideoxy-N-acetyl-beta-L-altrosamine transaminase